MTTLTTLRNVIDRTVNPRAKAEEMGEYVRMAIADGNERWAVHYTIYAYRYAEKFLENRGESKR